ncbi:MerR family transcriptional regulator [Streptomyces lavendulae]|uniref:MerR family transcriptional regulator n=1 Tax=Streptomyces lavendulae TaxID=1914 RepID=UPI0024A13F09|nr:MerR family transcriptional regulator [Streptomyces lavendulae]GLX16678.1 transcriptional regulator [Streptomyces lavendulae subsp. lavendulae]GLX25300.1 transcriptional regulator [Streptomyces lavendulae subsp. lavendulae]
MDPEPALSTGAVARRLGVSPTTLRSWERRYAIGPAHREDGRHRRWTPRDIARLEEMCRLTARGVPPSEAARAALGAAPAARAVGRAAAVVPGGPGALPLGEARPEGRGLARAAVRLDQPAVAELLEAALAEHGLVTTWEEVIAPTLHAVGRKWASAGERYVEVEHLLSWQVSAALHRIRPAPDQARVPPVLLACVPGELHSLPIEALAAALGERGVPVRMFGAALPAGALCDAVRRTGPRAAVLWAHSRTTADRALARSVAGIEWGLRGARGHSVLLLAGPGWGPESQGPRTGRLFGLRSGLGVIADLVAGRAPATAAGRGGPAAYGS